MATFKKFKFSAKTNELTNQHAVISVSPLAKGFGTTLGNALRRTMLLSIPGASVFAVKINNATHEFQSIPDVKEDVINIILNIKKLVVKINPEIYSEEDLNSMKLEN
jgi:DNA-directed RNA polymerase subunit alpha